MYRIGDFSKIVDIPIRTLRYYDEYGILKPGEIDNFTGYRYYSEENIIECESIKLLKSLDFTLEEILLYRDSIDNNAIEKKKQEFEERIHLLKLKYKRLLIMQKELSENRINKNDIEEKDDEKVLRRKYEKRSIGKNLQCTKKFNRYR